MALDKRLIPGVLTLKTNRMNNDNEANGDNDNGNELYVGQPETERQELLRLRRDFEQARQRILQEREQLLRDIQRLCQEM